jgi:hypothetical protein
MSGITKSPFHKVAATYQRYIGDVLYYKVDFILDFTVFGYEEVREWHDKKKRRLVERERERHAPSISYSKELVRDLKIGI